jgi:hypothetical protein
MKQDNKICKKLIKKLFLYLTLCLSVHKRYKIPNGQSRETGSIPYNSEFFRSSSCKLQEPQLIPIRTVELFSFPISPSHTIFLLPQTENGILLSLSFICVALPVSIRYVCEVVNIHVIN